MTPKRVRWDRRQFGVLSGTAIGSIIGGNASDASEFGDPARVTFDGPDSLYLGDQLQSLNPGFWQIKGQTLRRRLINVGQRARTTGFPFHAESHGFEFQARYDPSLPVGVAYLPQWDLTGAYEVHVDFTFVAPRGEVPTADDPNWRMHRDGHAVMGIALGSQCLFESYGLINNATVIGWTDDGFLRVVQEQKVDPFRQGGLSKSAPGSVARPSDPMPVHIGMLDAGERCRLIIRVRPIDDGHCEVSAHFIVGDQSGVLTWTMPSPEAEGFVGVAARGGIDFSVDRIEVIPGDNQPRTIGSCECLTCYPLGDTLHRDSDGRWRVRFVALFAADGDQVQIRISDTADPPGGWQSVDIAGSADIVNNDYRRHTAIVEAALPKDPSQTTMYYTVWKDGVDVTADGRVGTDACGPGTGLVGDVPSGQTDDDAPVGGNYVGRLPQLAAPYKMFGLSCHAIHEGLQVNRDGRYQMVGGTDRWKIRDQPTEGAYQHINRYDPQIMVWEDDVWYMELLLYPPSTDDAYKIIALSIAGPTSRYQMMRHWNVINPGDHDYGMDDIKGPEQLILRRRDNLGQDAEYLRRNFQIVHHLTTGETLDDPRENPKKWRAWRMPNRDFTFLILDSRLWRSSQDVDIWDDAGWGHQRSLYDRTDPTRSLLGEEQFGWLQQWLTTDASPLIGITGLSGLHTVWAGPGDTSQSETPYFDQRDRVVADYAGWVKAGADRVIDLLSRRDGIVTVYGDVHNGCLMMNEDNRLIECSFGPIGRSGGRAVIPGFGRQMRDFDGRKIQVSALYHKTHRDPDLTPHEPSDPYYWNFLQMEFDPHSTDSNIRLAIRNLLDAPDKEPRGGGSIDLRIDQTGRPPTSTLPPIKTLASADVRLMTTGGQPIRAARSDEDGVLSLQGLVDIDPGTDVILTAYDGRQTRSTLITTQPV